MAEFQDAKPGDLITTSYPEYNGGGIHSEAVVIGLPTGETHSGGHLGLNPSTIAPGVMCYRKFPGHDSGYFLTLNDDHWRNGAKADYTPRGQNEEASRRLLQDAKTDLTQPVYKGKSLTDLGLHVGNAEEVLNTIERLLQ